MAPSVSSAQIIRQFEAPEQCRNVCIVAHVDHGKTTLTDSLLASNGVISQKLAGQLRWMDQRADEQEREITMVSRTFPLLYQPDGETPFLVNLVDSPGHVDFQAQVSAASRLSDGCLVVVDVVEGVCAQTRTVLQQTLPEGLSACLVLNKIDRLVLELAMEGHQVLDHLKMLIENLNNLTARLMKPMGVEQENYFAPERGNVIFCSAVDGWGFRIADVASFYLTHPAVGKPLKRALSKLDSTHESSDELQQLIQIFWDDSYSLDLKSESFVPIRGTNSSVICQLLFDPLWKLYKASCIDFDYEKTCKIVNTLSISNQMLTGKEKSFAKQGRSVLRTICSTWLPLSTVVFECIIENVPSTVEMNRKGGKRVESQQLAGKMENISLNESPSKQQPQLDEECFVLISKLMPIIKNDQLEQLIGVSKVLHGSFKVGDSLILSSDASQFSLDHVYLIMGNDLVPIPSQTVINTGCIVGIGGSDTQRIIKKAYLSTNIIPNQELPKDCSNGKKSSLQTSLVRVAVEPKSLADLDQLRIGLQILNQVEEDVEVTLQENGQYIIGTAGELHLEQVLKDLIEIYARVPVNCVTQLPPFREGIGLDKSAINLSFAKELDSQHFAIEDDTLIVDYEEMLKFEIVACCLNDELMQQLFGNITKIRDQLKEGVDCAKIVASIEATESCSAESNIVAMGPLAEPVNLLSISKESCNEAIHPLLPHLKYAFQLATVAGPVCGEPMMGVSFLVKNITIGETATGLGKLISLFRDAFLRAFLLKSVRLFLATYDCEIFVSPEIFGRVCGIINKRHGRIVHEQFDEQMNIFTVEGQFPIIEGSGFADELRTKTSGLAVPQLQFGGFFPMDAELFARQDSIKREEDDDDEEKIETRARALKYIQTIRESKGLFVDKEIESNAQKQSTLKR